MFTDPFIRRPVLATVVSLLIVLLGMQAFSKLVIREYPQMENALITVTTLYAGANAETIQGYITQPLQQSLASAEGIDYMTSVSRQNYSIISIYARIGANTDRLVTELLSKIGEVKSQLPPDAEDPILDKEAADASALMYISFYSEQMNNPQITDYLSRVIQPKLATLPGIAEAEILGNQVFAMRLWLDPVKMAAYGVTAGDVGQRGAAVQLPRRRRRGEGRAGGHLGERHHRPEIPGSLRRHSAEDRRRPPRADG